MNQFLLLISFVIACFAFGQDFQSRIVKEKTLGNSQNHVLIGTTTNQLLGLSKRKEQLAITIYDKDSLHLLYNEQLNKLPGAEKIKQLHIEGVYKVKDQFRLVALGVKPYTREFIVFVYTILENGKLSEEYDQTAFRFDEEDGQVYCSAETNADQSLLLIQVQTEGYSVFNALIYNEQPEKLFQTAHNPPNFGKRMDKVDVNYFAGKKHVYELYERAIYNRSLGTYESGMELKQYDLSNGTVVTRPFNIEDGFVLMDARIREEETGIQLYASYCGSSGKQLTGIRGIYTVRFNGDLSMNAPKIHLFSQDTQVKSLRGHSESTQQDVSVLYRLNSSLTDSQGNNYLFYERIASMGSAGSLKEFYYGPILTVKVDAAGAVEWETLVSKLQYFKEKKLHPLLDPYIRSEIAFSNRFIRDHRRHVSFKPILKHDELFLVYNDHPENKNRTGGEPRKSALDMKESIPFVVHFSSSGTISYQPLSSLEIGMENQEVAYSVLEGKTLFTLRNSEEVQVLQRIELE